MSSVDVGRGPLDRAASSVREVGAIAAAHHVRVAIEFNSQAEQCNNLGTMREVLAAAGHPSFGLLLDTYHMGRSGCDPKAIEDVAPEEIAYIQYSDVPRSGLQPGQTLDRLPPGQGSFPFKALLAVLRAKHYDGPMS